MKRYYRSRSERRIAGVCGGLGELLDWDPTLVRLGFVFLLLPTGIIPLIVVYLAAWAIVPEAEGPGSAPPDPPPAPPHSA
jgi:phage shock protein PspC (stress-responsive transcriptional regulator)